MRIYYIVFLASLMFITVEGQESLSLNFGHYKVTVNPLVGGRIFHFQYDEKELLAQFTISSDFYGASLYPSPQSRSEGFTPEQLDLCPYTTKIKGDTIMMYSEMDYMSGLRIAKKLFPAPDKDALVLEYVATSQNAEAIKTSISETVRLPGGITFFPYSEPTPDQVSNSNISQMKNSGDVLWYEYKSDEVKGNRSFLSMSSEGWVAHKNGNLIFIKIYKDLANNEVAENHGEIEISAIDQPEYIAIATSSPLVELNNGDKTTSKILWTVMPHKGSLKIGDKKIIDRIRHKVRGLQSKYLD